MQEEKNVSIEVSSPKQQGETISELAHRHLNDVNHTTSDEEIRNAEIEVDSKIEVDEENLFEVVNTTVIPPLPGETDNDVDNDKDQPRSIPNPYDVLG